MMNRCKLFVVCMCAVTLVGCDGGSNPVGGTVKLSDGTPVKTGRIFFASNELQMSANGAIQPDGSYQLTTFEENDGAPVGTYVVTITAVEQGYQSGPPPGGSIEERRRDEAAGGDTSPGPGPESLVHSKYADAKTTDLRAEVKSGPNTIDFVVEPPEVSTESSRVPGR